MAGKFSWDDHPIVNPSAAPKSSGAFSWDDHPVVGKAQAATSENLTADQYKSMTDEDKQKMVLDNIKQMKESSGVAQDSALNTMALQYLPQIKAKIGQVFSGEGISNDDNYLKRRDQAIADMKSGAEKYPLQNAAGVATGLILPAAASPALQGLGMIGAGTSALAPIADGANAAANIAKPTLAQTLKTVGKAGVKSALVGAGYGLAGNPGDVEGKVDPIQAPQRLANAKTGAMIAAPIGMTAASLPYVAQKLDDLSNTKAFKAAGAMLKDFRKANDRGQTQELGQFMHENGLIKAGDTYSSIADKAEQLKQDTGDQLGKGYDASVKIIQGMGPEHMDKVDAAGFNPIRDKDAILKKVADQLSDSTEKKSVLNHVSNYLDQLGEDYGDKTLDPKAANKIKTKLDSQAINWQRNPMANEPEKEAGYKVVRQFLGNKVSNQIGTIGDIIGNDQAAQNLAELNSKYGKASTISNIAGDRVSREDAKAAMGVSDIGYTGTGAAIGSTFGPVGTAVGAGVGFVGGKVAKTYGPALTATGLKTAAGVLSKLPNSINKAAVGEGISGLLNSTERQSIGSSLLPKAADQQKQKDQMPAQSQPLKGQDKWANDGADKVQDHVEQDDNSDLDAELFSDKEAMLSNPKVKSLLIQASDLKPGSRAMANIAMKIKSQLEKANA